MPWPMLHFSLIESRTNKIEITVFASGDQDPPVE